MSFINSKDILLRHLYLRHTFVPHQVTNFDNTFINIISIPLTMCICQGVSQLDHKYLLKKSKTSIVMTSSLYNLTVYIHIWQWGPIPPFNPF